MHIIGLIGLPGSGKGRSAELIGRIVDEYYPPLGPVTVVKFSDVLVDEALTRGLPPARDVLQNISLEWEAAEPGVLSRKTMQRGLELAASQKSEILILDGVRWQHDFDIIDRHQPHSFLYLIRDIRLRYQSAKKRAEKPGEQLLSFDAFCEAEKVSTETFISALGQRADYRIVNNDSVDHLRRALESVCGDIFR